MNKYKLVGKTNLVLGTAQVFLPILYPVFVFPRLFQVYKDFGGDLPRFTGVYVMLTLILLMGIINVVLGLLNLSSSKEEEEYFKYGKISIIASSVLTGLLVAILTSSILAPIYILPSEP